jgi:hypothetical protein
MTTEQAKDRIRGAMAAWSEDQERERLGLRKKPRRLGKSEHEEQAEVVRWLMDHNLDFVAIPNAGQRSYYQAAKLRSEGMQRGFPDLLILTQPPKSQARGVALEMKKFHGGTIRPEQYAWLKRLEGCGYVTHVAEGARSAIVWLESLGFGAVRP